MGSKLSARELEILYTLWDAEKPLMASQIANEELSLATVHTTLKRMLKKNLVKVVDFSRNGNVFGRCYEPAIDRGQYELKEFVRFVKNCKSKEITMSYVVEMLLEDLNADERLKELDKLEKVIKEIREEKMEEDKK